MGRKAPKSAKKFATSGRLKKTIEARHKSKQFKKKFQSRRGHKDSNGREKPIDESDEEEETLPKASGSTKRMTVDSFLSGNFMEASEDENVQDGADMETDEEEESDGYHSDDNASFASVDDLDEQGQNHLLELSKLAERDPEFYEYLQENDRELLEFDLNADDDDDSVAADENGDVRMEVPILTKEHLRRWKMALLQQMSLRALRKLIIAFRSAAHMNEDGQVLAWRIDSSSVYNALVTTVLRYTPMVLAHHVPYKTLPNGKFKPPTQTQKFKTLQKLILSHFHNAIHLFSQLSQEETLRLALTESAKLIPYIITSRKCVKIYLKKCLELWSTGSENVRLAAFLAVRKLAMSPDDSTLDAILKSTYLKLVRSLVSINAHTLPSITLMKNSASDVFCFDHATAYQHAFGYIRQLAIHLRNSMKIKTKEAYKNVYNWQFVHCVDFWCVVLGRACDIKAEAASGKTSELRPLIYPLVQVSLGAIKLVPNSRYHPFHLQIIRSLLNLSKHTQTYIPLAAYIFPILSTYLSPSCRSKASTLKPLDLEVQINVPQQYMKTRVLSEGMVEEATFVLMEWLVSEPVHGSIGFPEIVVPVVVMLRRCLKGSNANAKGKGSKGVTAGNGKEHGVVKVMLERIEDSAKWIEQKRSRVVFAPSRMGEVDVWEEKVRDVLDESPLGKYLKVQKKARDKRRSLIEKAREGREEILEED